WIMQAAAVGSELSEVGREDLFAVPTDVAGVDPEGMDEPACCGHAGVAAVCSGVAEPTDGRVLPEHPWILGRLGGPHGLRPVPPVARRAADEPGVVPRGVARRVVVT